MPARASPNNGHPSALADDAEVGNPGVLDAFERPAGRAGEPRDDEPLAEHRPRHHGVGRRRHEAADGAHQGQRHLSDAGARQPAGRASAGKMRDEKRQREHARRVLRRARQSCRQPGERVVAPPAAVGDRREPPQRPRAEQEQQAFAGGKMRHVDEAHRHRGKPRGDEACRLIDDLPPDPEDQENRRELAGEREEPRQTERQEQDRPIGVIRVGQLGVGGELIPERLPRGERVRQREPPHRSCRRGGSD